MIAQMRWAAVDRIVGRRLAPASPAGAGERQVLTRAWRRIAIQTAALFTGGVMALGALAVGVVLNIADRDAQRQLAQATNDPDAVTNPPIDVTVYEHKEGRLEWSPGASSGPFDPGALTAVADGPVADSVVRRDGRDYLVRTVRRDSTTTQVGLDLTEQQTERMRLVMGVGAAGVAGLILAGGFGTLIARRAIAPLGHALARQQRFVADASHELRTPLTQLHTRAQLLERELRPTADAQVRDDLDQLVRGTRQMGELLEELLLSAQLRVEPQRHRPVDLGTLAAQTVLAEQARASQRGVEVVIDAPADGTYLVRGTEAPLRRVLVSLVDNALSHTPAGGRIAIELRADRGGRIVEARVTDDGEGFGPGETQRLFERFYRGNHGDGRRFGLGLSLVREVVVAHGGTVTASAAPDRGACFIIRLPAWRTKGGDTPPSRS